MRKRTIDEYYMHQALSLAPRGMGKTTPNPMVGCVIVRDGVVIGKGWHDHLGGLHAEAAALKDAGNDVKGATVYVSLEPCSHWGRQPPCADALVAAQISRCVAAIGDPNPKVAGKGFAKLKAAGIETECGILAWDAAWLNRGFLSLQVRHRPWVTLKAAISEDGSMALSDGTSQWITCPSARALGHMLRSENDVIITGTGTLTHDNPMLTVRAVEGASPRPVIISSSLSYLNGNYAAVGSRTIAISSKGTDIPENTPAKVHLVSSDKNGRPSLEEALKVIADLGFARALVEAGGKLTSSFISSNLVDEYQIFIAPKFMGEGRKITGEIRLANMDQAIPIKRLNSRYVNNDLWIEGANPCSLDWLKQLAQ